LRAPFLAFENYSVEMHGLLDEMGTVLGLLFQRSDDLLDFDVRNYESKAILGDLKSGYLNSFSVFLLHEVTSEQKAAFLRAESLEEIRRILRPEYFDRRLSEFDKIKADFEALKAANVLREGEMQKLDIELTEYKDIVKGQEEDLDKFEEEIVKLREELQVSSTKIKELEQGGMSSGGEGGDVVSSSVFRQKELEARILKEKNISLEKAAATLAAQVTQLCDAVERGRELEGSYSKLDRENERLANEVKVLEAELNARETEIENVLSDNEQLVLKLNSLGLKVKLTDEGITFDKE